MTWLTWRQCRIEMLVMGFMLLGFAIVLLVTGIGIATEAQQVGLTPTTSCASNTLPCFQAFYAMNGYFSRLTQPPSVFWFTCFVLPYVLPVLAGIFLGAPALSGEFEQGTHRLIWTQGIPWSRWFFQKAGLLIGAAACAFAILFGLLSWWSAALSGLLSHVGWFYGNFSNNYFQGTNYFDTWGVVIVAYAVFAVALGLFFGAVVRKPMAAMALTLILFIVVRVLVTHYWRPYYLPPVVAIASSGSALSAPGDSWSLSYSVIDQHGQPVDNILPCQNNTCSNEHGFRNEVVYQPSEHFWLFQGIESGIYLLFSAILIASTYAWTKYRIIGKERRSSSSLSSSPIPTEISLETRL